MAAQIGAMQAPHLNARKDQAVQLGGFKPGGLQAATLHLGGVRAEGRAAQRSRKTGALRDSGRGKHRASRRAGYLG
jgi:hypothetical protein